MTKRNGENEGFQPHFLRKTSRESIIEPDNVIEDLPVLEAEIESEIVDDVKDELRSDINTETQENQGEGWLFFSRLVKGASLKTKAKYWLLGFRFSF